MIPELSEWGYANPLVALALTVALSPAEAPA
jgi:hypothetical protein